MKDLNIVSMEHAVSTIKSGDRVWIGGATGISYEFISTMEKNSKDLKDINIIGGMVLNPKQQFMRPDYKGTFFYTSLFLGPLERVMRPLGNMELNTTHYSCM
ncbi:TPA: acetyl-CoA hydrolase/transferase family protein, partial [Photobacterium damselae]